MSLLARIAALLVVLGMLCPQPSTLCGLMMTPAGDGGSPCCCSPAQQAPANTTAHAAAAHAAAGPHAPGGCSSCGTSGKGAMGCGTDGRHGHGQDSSSQCERSCCIVVATVPAAAFSPWLDRIPVGVASDRATALHGIQTPPRERPPDVG